jgi:hypothetical protein
MCHYDRATHVAYDTLATIPYQASSSAPRLVRMQLLLFGPSNALATPSLIRTHTIWGVPRDLEQRSHHSRVLRSNWYLHDPPWRWGTQFFPEFDLQAIRAINNEVHYRVPDVTTWEAEEWHIFIPEDYRHRLPSLKFNHHMRLRGVSKGYSTRILRYLGYLLSILMNLPSCSPNTLATPSFIIAGGKSQNLTHSLIEWILISDGL